MNKFRYDINGLRAYAVFAVVLFHFNHNWLPGGFAGVDVFFVISGFLMTKIIINNIEKNTFNLFSFLKSRANRLIPALLMLCLTLSIFGFFFLSPFDYKQISKHIFGSLMFVSNFIYWSESGYFDSSSLSKWLLHTWSLSVEWQFYILYPIILLFLSKFFSINSIKKILILGTFLGFLISIFISNKWTSAGYFLLPTRAWEMMFGGIAFLYPLYLRKDSYKNLQEIIGFILIFLTFFFISDKNIWPGYLAFIPVFGTYLILSSNRQNSILTKNIFLQKIGLWSYSIYLWHWPLVILGNYFEITNWYLIGIPLSILLGYLSYRFIEKVNLNKYMVLLLISLSIFSIYVYSNNGLYSRFNKEKSNKLVIINAQKDRPKYDSHCFNYTEVPACTYLDGKKLTTQQPSHILLGDSHAQSLVNGIAHSLNQHKNYTGLKFYGMAGCLFSENIDSIYPKMKNCGNLTRKTFKEIQEKYPKAKIIYVSRLSALIHGDSSEDNYDSKKYQMLQSDISRTMEKLTKSHDVYFLTPTPEFHQSVPDYMSKNIVLNNNKILTISTKEYDQRNKLALSLLEFIKTKYSVKILDTKPYFCSNELCYSSTVGIPYYRDDNHISEFGNKRLLDLFNRII